ncbi:hypothetical protein [Paramaledivibacter caminithermalis]|uniref:Uncharacterized protein n=1 Tax=Paramaledivibacter caminithermalis (strain DSM 15212 / CIP 107654 / DViRD3) TaxID=1121301 RepID=A0A1M6QFM4_PARC5|nr:hypothetical protein [Paramaledivibacter caminithermalis]SHK19011.1 hypothetical protein SAMN02745912_02554 [Paramaledivibacter caminithermalis DSM 15212]
MNLSIDNLIQYYFLIVGIVTVILGIFLVCGKKIMISRIMLSSFPFINFIIIMIIDIIRYPFSLKITIIYGFTIIVLLILVLKFTKGKYVVNNVNYDVFIKEMQTYFIKNNIEYDEVNGEFTFQKNRNRKIKIRSSSSNTIEVDLKEVRNDRLYYDIKDAMRKSLKNIKDTYYSWDSIIILIVGIIAIIVAVLWL